MATIFGIQFAPLFIPLKRRLQTLAVLYFGLEFLPLAIFYIALLVYLLYTRFYFITLAYSLWYFYDLNAGRTGGKRGRWLRKWTLWKHVRDYFPISLVKTTDLDPNKNYLFAIHPHGIFSFGAIINFATEANNVSKLFPGLTTYLLTLDERFYCPITREIVHSLGSRSVCRESIEYLLTKNGIGNIVGIVVGGASEVLDAFPKTMKLNLKNRKGFVKMAMKTGTSLVPVLSFGENDVYNQVGRDENCLLRKLQRRITSITRASPPLFYGRGIFQYSFGLMPFRKPIITVVGEPLNVPKNEKPTDEEINQIHDEYIMSLKRLFLQNKNKYGFSDLELVIE